jgi:hypothetical protein
MLRPDITDWLTATGTLLAAIVTVSTLIYLVRAECEAAA